MTMHRREFLKAAGTAAALPVALARAESSSPTSARLFVGCCALSYGKYLDAGSMTLEGFFGKAVELGRTEPVQMVQPV